MGGTVHDQTATDQPPTKPPPTKPPPTMTFTIEVSDDLKDRLDEHLEPEETYAELIEELLSIYETDGTFLQEGYSE